MQFPKIFPHPLFQLSIPIELELYHFVCGSIGNLVLSRINVLHYPSPIPILNSIRASYGLPILVSRLVISRHTVPSRRIVLSCTIIILTEAPYSLPMRDTQNTCRVSRSSRFAMFVSARLRYCACPAGESKSNYQCKSYSESRQFALTLLPSFCKLRRAVHTLVALVNRFVIKLLLLLFCLLAYFIILTSRRRNRRICLPAKILVVKVAAIRQRRKSLKTSMTIKLNFYEQRKHY